MKMKMRAPYVKCKKSWDTYIDHAHTHTHKQIKQPLMMVKLRRNVGLF